MTSVKRWQACRWKLTDWKNLMDFDNDIFLAFYHDLITTRFVAMCTNCNDYILAHFWFTFFIVQTLVSYLWDSEYLRQHARGWKGTRCRWIICGFEPRPYTPTINSWLDDSEDLLSAELLRWVRLLNVIVLHIFVVLLDQPLSCSFFARAV